MVLVKKPRLPLPARRARGCIMENRARKCGTIVPTLTYSNAQDLCCHAQKRQAGRGASGHFFRFENYARSARTAARLRALSVPHEGLGAAERAGDRGSDPDPEVCVSNVAAVPLPASALFRLFVPPRLVARAHRAARTTIESPGSADIRQRSIRRWRSPGTLFSFPAARLLRCSFRQCNRYQRHRAVPHAVADN